jgi:uncharacterized protein
MDHEGVWLLVTGIAALSAGPVLYQLAQRVRGGALLLHALVAIVVGTLVVLEIVPECVRDAGWLALAFAAIGVLAPIAIDRGFHARGAKSLPLWLAFGAVVLHAMADGMALSTGAHEAHAHVHDGSHGLALAVVIHRVPEGAALWCVLMAAGRRVALAGIALDAVFSVLGFALGAAALGALGHVGVALAQAFLAGVLLHVLVHKHEGRSELAHARC